ncbi:hypothetical protein [Vagococcus sp.]
MPEVIIFLIFIGVGCSLWGLFYGKKVKNNGSKKRTNNSKK